MKTLVALSFVLLVASAFATSRVEFGQAIAEADKARESADGPKYAGALAAAMKDVSGSLCFDSTFMAPSQEELSGLRCADGSYISLSTRFG